MLKRCLVSCAVLAPNYGRTCAPGELVDLAERLPNGGTLADLVRPEWFEPIEPAAEETAPARGGRRRAIPDPEPTTDEPGDPAKE